MLVIDASVAVKFVVNEVRADAAYRLAQSGEVFIAPELIWGEVTNTLWKKVRRGEVDAGGAFAASAGLQFLFSEVVPLGMLRADALQIAIDLDHPAYDCFYLALAEQRNIALVTDDHELIKRTRNSRFSALVRPLA